ncbi:hypothetical protein NUW58_g8766 [Xylaria curta]|uniref:Uncharacterized protein n=1 Tax=Xylaria curta TaxID=42375 RepID=A0ACC1N6J6_9PEZI|nr:hypothetical protein NUW58_g8766 [Xylaria curta]
MEPRSSPDGPPPPYSETDIYSHSPGPRNRHSNVPDDDASIAPSSSHSNIIFTPPESPRDAQDSFTGPSGGQHTTTSAQDYFDSRPPNRRPGPNLTIVLEVTPSSVPSDFPYARFRIDGRDVTEQDWQTFINYLIPGHAARTNSHIIDRKLRDAGDAQTSGSNAIAEAQSVSLKSSPSEPKIDTVTREWNRGFFEPRGITIRTAAPADPAVEDAQTPEYEVPRENTADAEQSQSQPQQASSWWTNPFGFLDGRNGSLHLGPLHIEGDRVALGSTFEADRNGVRWCGPPNTNQQFEANSRGVYWGDQHGPPAHPHPFMHRGRHPWPGPFGGPFGDAGADGAAVISDLGTAGEITRAAQPVH